MNATLKNLIALQEVTHHYEENGQAPSEWGQIEQLRVKIPANILRRFDHLAERRPFPVVQMSESGACGNCHLKLTPNDVLRFRRASEPDQENAFTCPFCGCFLYSPAEGLETTKASHE